MYPRCVFLSLYKGDKGGYNFFLPKMEINSFNILLKHKPNPDILDNAGITYGN